MCVFLPAVSKLDHWNAEAVIITQQPGNTDTPVWEEHIHRLYDSNITELHTTAEIWRSLLTNQWQSSMNLWGCDCSADTELPAARGKWTENKPHSNISPFARLEQWTCVQTELRLFPRHGDVLSFFLLNVTVSSPPLSSSISTYRERMLSELSQLCSQHHVVVSVSIWKLWYEVLVHSWSWSQAPLCLSCLSVAFLVWGVFWTVGGSLEVLCHRESRFDTAAVEPDPSY